jgi:hypothetical protein
VFAIAAPTTAALALSSTWSTKKIIPCHGGEDGEPGQFHVTLTFDDHNGKTLLTMRSLFESAAARDWVVKEHHAIEGGNQTLDRLQEHLATMEQRTS